MWFAQRRSAPARILLRHQTTAFGIYPQVHLSIQPHVFFNGVWAIAAERERRIERTFQSLSREFQRGVGSELVRHRHERRVVRPLEMAFRRLYGIDTLSRTVRREISEHSAVLLADRIVHTTRRIEDVAVPRPAAALHAAVTAPPREAGVELQQRVVAPFRPLRQQATSNAVAATAANTNVNVDEITDHVLRQLDRRITAWRERTGRV